PSMDACRFAERLDAEPMATRPRLVFRAPAYIETEARMVAKDFGAHFLARPANPEGLLAVVATALSEERPQREAAGQPVDDYLRMIAASLQQHAEDLDRLNAQ